MARSPYRTFILAISLLTSVCHAATTTPAVNPTGTSNSFPTITDTENTGSSVGSVDHSGVLGGASGGNGGAFQLSTGAVVGIAVACGLIVVAIITLWALWFIAKRRQMTMRETISRASRRLTGRKVPPTPRTPRAPKTPTGNKRGATFYGRDDLEKGATKSIDRSRSVTPEQTKTAAKPSKYDAFMGRK